MDTTDTTPTAAQARAQEAAWRGSLATPHARRGRAEPHELAPTGDALAADATFTTGVVLG